MISSYQTPVARRQWGWISLLLTLASGVSRLAPAQSPRSWVVKTKSGHYELRSGTIGVQGGDNEIVERLIPYHSLDLRIQVVPNDPLYPQQWGLSESGIRWLRARDAGADGAGVTVAVIDTGVRRDAPDLQSTQLLAGADLVNNDSDPTDDNGHGTHVTGTIAQTTDNALGCAGIAPKAMILPIKVLDGQGSGSNYTVASGVRYAADHGANVINLSLGGGASAILQDAVRYAVGKGVVICAAAGNGGTRGLSYPGAYPEVISVGAITGGGQRASFSQYGAELSLCAPGVGILQQTWNPATRQFYYGSWSGTSMATPHVAGLCALVRQRNATLTPQGVKDLLMRTARDLGLPGRDDAFGAGCIDATAALSGAATSPQPPAPSPTPAPIPASWVTDLLNRVNAARAQAGVAPLALESRLGQAAQGWAQYMADHRYFSHTAPDGSGPGQRIHATGYPFRTWGENIAWGYTTPEAVMNGWMNSAGHRANLLNPNFREIGLGRAAGSEGRLYWVQDFGAR